VIGAWLYTLTRLVVDAFMMRRRDRAALEAEVLVLRRQVQVLERQIRRVHWSPDDRMLLAALRDRLPKVAWNGLLVKPATVLGWHREMVRRRWAAYGKRPRRGRPPLPTETCQSVARRMAALHLERLPVVADAESRQLIGIVSRSDLVKLTRATFHEENVRERIIGKP